MPETQTEQAFIACERIRKLIATTPIEPITSITISGGIATNKHSNTISELLRQSDLALYQAKDQGRNRCIVWSPSLDSSKRPAD